MARASLPGRERARRWTVLRQAARTRLGPLGVVVMLLAIVAALFAPVISPYDPLKQDLGNTLARPDRSHLMGTDNVGRDVLSRMVWGTRVSLMAGFGSVALAMVTGGLLGLLAGYAGGRADGLVMRVMDAVLSFPPLVLALALGAVLGAGITGVVIALGVVYTPTFARLMRGQVLTITARDYVEAARALGAPGWRVARDPGLAQRGLRHTRRSLAVFPRPGHTAAGRLLGQHDQRGPRLSPAGALDSLLAGRGLVRHGGGIELRGRRRARSPRPATSKVRNS